MKTAIIITMFFLSISSSCENYIDNQDNHTIELIEKFNKQRIWDFDLDTENNIIILTSERDTSIYTPAYSSHIPMKYKLFKKDLETGELREIDNNFPRSTKIAVDNGNNILAIGKDTLFMRKPNGEIQFITNGWFESMVIDSKNNVWIGGPGLNMPGLYKIDPELNITIYSNTNSILPTNRVTCIHVDNFDNIWVGLGDSKGLLKISNENWELINSENSNIPKNIQIECFATDNVGNLWIAGNDTEKSVIYKMRGMKWINQFSKYKGKKESESIQELQIIDEKAYAISFETYKYSSYITSDLLIYDGNNWENLSQLLEDQPVLNSKIINESNIIIFNTVAELYKLKN